ncbi:hypothetical protein [Mycobacteroides abscessus]|uniref:Uncharacterized protein n=1 Tax=Mycobacteroides abscessus subsp. massiliense TaxID=1962118 RepID=A0A1U1DSV8_9MYCO|nr:hypothetical protein [Mycobacteroides abscessus]EIV67413.1 hypothetical protein MMCCUG48898_0742 [Mycobacteroides abscessus subsp. massiliense CCUG 48898 = JCM 15300]MBL3748571.1 hypothetical protein [Mycobacteroides abscessus subsp. massiliense]ORA86052.1 hypothetical protein BST32_24640 [Mycobacteroides abscessus subsp. massiliense]SKE61628.1 Uncharacterised protein [Mycobacteroides abscessus subsp. massiliense]SKH62500.1 Uncharacterised protein [Mycobacteroides abscessus subsp. massilien
MGATSRSLVELIESAARRHDGASGRRLAEIAQRGGHEVSHATLNRLRQGTYASRPSDTSIRAIAYLAEVPETVAFAAAAVRPPMADRYEPPAEAQRMTTPQRKAIDQLLRAFIGDHVPVNRVDGVDFSKLLAVREQLATAVAHDDAVALLETGRCAVQVIDEVTAALFAAAGSDNSADHEQQWPPMDSAALIAVAP